MDRIVAQIELLISSFKQINSNAKRILLFEPLFTIPYAMFVIYSSIYMTRVGVKDYQIGILSTVLNFVMLISAPVAGMLVNRFGRKKILLIGDFLAWVAYAYIFFFAKDFKWFLIATIFNGLMRISELAWRLLLMEDATENERVAIYSITVFIWNVGNLFAPLMGFLVAKFGLILATKGIVLVFGILVNILIFVRHLITSESSVGIKMVEKSNKEDSDRFGQWAESIKYMMNNRNLLLIIIVIILGNISQIFRDTYKNIYLSEKLKYADDLISTFPTIWSVVTLVFIIFMIPSLKEKNHNKILLWGMILITASNLIFLFIKPGLFGFVLMVLVTIIGAIGSSIYFSFVDAILANSIDDDRRAHILSLAMFLISLFSMPAGAIAGQCYNYSKLLPFVVSTIFTLFCIILIYKRVKLNKG